MDKNNILTKYMNLILIASLHLDGGGLIITDFFWFIREEINHKSTGK